MTYNKTRPTEIIIEQLDISQRYQRYDYLGSGSSLFSLNNKRPTTSKFFLAADVSLTTQGESFSPEMIDSTKYYRRKGDEFKSCLPNSIS